MIITKSFIDSTITSHCPELRDLGVKKIGLFGSAARDQMREESDLDFLVVFEEGRKNFDNYMDVAYLLEDLFNKQVDLVTPEALSENLKKNIYSEVTFIEI